MLDATLRKSPSITKVGKEGNALFLYSERGVLRLLPQTEKIVRVTYTENGVMPESVGVGIIYNKNLEGWEFSENEDTVTLKTSELNVVVNKAAASISYYDKNGRLLLSERESESRITEEYSARKVGSRKTAKIKKVATPDGVKSVVVNSGSSQKFVKTWLHLSFSENEKLYGLGQAEEGVLNLRGTTQYLHQANMKIAVPFLLSSNGYGILLSTGSTAVFSDTQYGSYLYTEADSAMDFYFVFGETDDEIIKGYRLLTGKASMLPKWAFGFWQSQERYETQDEIIKIADEFEKRKIGVDCIVLDWQSWSGNLWGQKTFDKKRFPNPKMMTDTLHKNNIRFMISVWPNMSKKCPNYREFKRKRLLLPKSDIYDAFDEKGEKLYWKQLKDGLYSNGVDAWWCDASEPVSPEWSCKNKPEPFEMYRMFNENISRHIPLNLANTYGAFHAKSIYDGQRNENDGKRVVNLTRSTYTGGQKYGVVLWSGDISASWETLRKQIAAGLGFCASGFPYWTLDIGAFFVKKGVQWFWNGDYNGGADDEAYRELFVRWFQYGAFLPVFRSHGTDVRREIWNFGDGGEPFYDALVSANRLRYSLIPYIYSLAGMVWRDDYTIMRMLHFDFPNDDSAAEIDDQYMFGPSLMVCPVTKSAATRSVYLPDGTDWYDFYNDEKYTGGREITVDLDISHIPLFVKAGSIIPMTKPLMHTDEEANAELVFHIYPGKDGEFTLYEDDGDGYSYEQGDYTLTKFFWNDREQTLIVPDTFKRKYKTVIHNVK